MDHNCNLLIYGNSDEETKQIWIELFESFEIQEASNGVAFQLHFPFSFLIIPAIESLRDHVDEIANLNGYINIFSNLTIVMTTN